MIDKIKSEGGIGRRDFLTAAVYTAIAGGALAVEEIATDNFLWKLLTSSFNLNNGNPVSSTSSEIVPLEGRRKLDEFERLQAQNKKNETNPNAESPFTEYNQTTSSNYPEPRKAPTEQIELKSAPKKNLEGMAEECLKKKSVGQTRASSGTYDRFGSNDMARDLQAHNKNYGKKPQGTDTNVRKEKPKSLVSDGKPKESDLESKAIEDLRKSEFELDGLYKILDKNGNETGMYLDRQLYKSLTKDVISGKPVKVFWIPGDFYVESGQGWFSRTGNQIATRGTFVPVYSNKYGRLDGVYTTQSRANKACGNNYDQSFKSFLEGCAGENCLRTPCVKFHEESVIFNPESLGGGEGPGVGGTSGGGGQNGGGSAGAR